MSQTLHREVDRITEERLMPMLLVMFVFWVVVGVEWTRRFAGAIPDPRFWSLVSLLVTVYGGAQVFRLHRFQNLVRHNRGMQQLAEVLARMRAKGFVTHRDVTLDGVRIRHVVVGPAGIYAVESKVRSGSGVIDYCSDEELIFGDRIKDGRPLRQARSAARVLQEQLNRKFENAPAVKPLLVFIGEWDVQRRDENLAVDVTTGRQLETYFLEQRPELSGLEIEQVSAALQHAA